VVLASKTASSKDLAFFYSLIGELVKQACLAGFFGRHGPQSNRNSISALLPSFQLLNKAQF
jgi:hypothetical protein